MLVEDYSRYCRDRKLTSSELATWLVNSINSGKYRYYDFYHLLNKSIAVKSNAAGSVLFNDSARISYLLKGIKDQQYFTLLLSFLEFETGVLKKQVKEMLTRYYCYDMLKEFNEIKTMRIDEPKNKAAYEDIATKLYVMSHMIEQYDVEVDINVQIRWMCMLEGYKQDEMIVIGAVLRRAVAQETSIKPDQVWSLLKQELLGSGNIGLLIAQLKSTTSMVRTFAYYLTKMSRPAPVLCLLFRDCIPPNLLIFTKKVIGEMRNLDNRTAQDIVSEFAIPVLYQNLSNTMAFREIYSLINSLLLYCKQLTLTSAEIQQLEAFPVNSYFAKEHKAILQSTINKCNAFGQSSISKNNGFRENAPPISNSTLFHPVSSKISQGSTYSSPASRIPHRGISNESRKEQIMFESEDFVGLPNIGNTCYINSFLINLYSCFEFRKSFRNQKPTGKTMNCLIRIFYNLDVKNQVGLKELAEEFKASLPENFSDNDNQHDCMEFGRYLIDMMMTEPSLTKYAKRLFESRFQEIIVCPYRHESSRREVTETHIILSFEKSSKIHNSLQTFHINDMIKQYFTPVKIESDFKCEYCKRSSASCYKYLEQTGFPQIWVVVLSRFTYNKQTQNYGKITDKVVADDYLLPSNLRNGSNRSVKYKLNSFVNHMGSTPLSGHYQAYVRHPHEQGRWLVYDDHYVMEMECKSTKELFDSFSYADTPYILIYYMIN